jgi:hypothetical protein
METPPREGKRPTPKQFEDPEEEDLNEKVAKNLQLREPENAPKMNPNAKPFSPPMEIKEKIISLPQLSPSPGFSLLGSSPVQTTLVCIVCTKESKNQQEILEHMLKEHSLVIGDIEKIADLER